MGTVVPEVGPELDADSASAAAAQLFNSTAWQERLDQARAIRERVLAERALKGDSRLDNMAGPRPWERQAAQVDPENLAERRRRRALAEAAAVSGKSALPKVPGFEGPFVPRPELRPELHPVSGFSPASVEHLNESPLPATFGATAQIPVVAPLADPANVAPVAAAIPAGAQTSTRGGARRSVLIGSAFAFGLGIGLGAMLVRAPAAPDAVVAPPQANLAEIALSREPATAAGIPAPGLIGQGATITDLSASLAAAAVTLPKFAPAVMTQPPAGPALDPNAGTGQTGPALVIAEAVPRIAAGRTQSLSALAERDAAAPALAMQTPSRPLVLTAVDRGDPGAGFQADLQRISYPTVAEPLAADAYRAGLLGFPAQSAGDSGPLPGSLATAPAPAVPQAGPYAAYRIRVLAPAGADQAEVASLADSMTAAGFASDTSTPLTVKVSRTHVRYYHPSDADAALAVAASVGAEVRDFTTMASPPPEGTVELWMSGRPLVAEAVPVRKKPAATNRTARKAAPAQPDPVQALRNRLAAKLRNGDHL